MGIFDNFNFNFNIGFNSKVKAPKKSLENSIIEDDISEEDLKIQTEALNEYYKSTQKNTVNSSNVEVPTEGGRSSVNNQRELVPNSFSPSTTEFPLYILPILEKLSIWNRHISYAVDNIENLANTEFEIEFDESISDERAIQFKAHLKAKLNKWYGFSVGSNSLTNDLIRQLATYGAISAEREPDKRLSTIDKIHLIPNFEIEFAYDKESDDYIPLQKLNNIGGVRNTSGSFAGYAVLNTETYKYVAMRRFRQEPYGIPAFLSAIQDIIIEKDMVRGFQEMMKRLGMLGFLAILVDMPAKDTARNESDTDYRNRLQDYLKVNHERAKEGFSQGMSVGYKGKHEFQVAGNTMNAGGAEKLMGIVNSLVFAGLKQDPNMMGQNQSTTETFGRVILAKMITQTSNYQKALKSFFEDTFALELRLFFRYSGDVTVTYSKPLIGDQKREQETEKIKIENAIAKYNQGLISQEKLSEMLNTGEPDEPEPRQIQSNDSKLTEEKEAETTEESENQKVVASLNKLGFGSELFPYECPGGCSHKYNFVSDFQDARLDKISSRYNNAIDKKFSIAIERSLSGIKKDISLLPEIATEQRLENVVISNLLKDWDKNFINRIDNDIKKNVSEAYNIFRKDEKVFKDAAGFNKSKESFFDIPESSLNLLDFRTIQYLEDLDRVYLGKFITDADTINRIKKFISKAYLSDNPLNSEEALDRFVEKFGEHVENERWKARRIIETTLNKSRNYANIMYINQAEITSFEIVEIVDQLTCDWCAHVDGMKFDVALEVQKIKDLTTGEIKDVAAKSPFATTIPIDQFTKMDAATIQSQNTGVPPNHGHCRGRLVADI